MLLISWVPPSTPNGEVTNYTIHCVEMLDNLDNGSGETEEPISSSFESNLTLSVTLPGNETETLFPDLMPFTFYSCYVSANTSAGEGNFSIHVVGRTDESSECLKLLHMQQMSLYKVLQLLMMLLAVSVSIL